MRRAKKHVSFASLLSGFRDHCDVLPDERQNGKRLADIVLSAFACMFFQDRSLLQFQRRMEDRDEHSNLTAFFGLEKIPEDTQLRSTLDSITPGSFRPFFKECFSRLQRGEKNSTLVYRWLNDVPLSGAEDAFSVNYFELEIFTTDDNLAKKRAFRSSRVTKLPLSAENIEQMVRSARCRWKIENECFNNLKNQGYHLEHNYGHGSQFLAFNFYLLTLIAFLFHQIFELTDHLFQEARGRWSTLIYYVRFLSWEQLLNDCLHPPEIFSAAPS